MQTEGHNSVPNIAEPAMVPVATQFQGVHGFNISGDPILANIDVNTGSLTTVNNYGETHIDCVFDLTELQEIFVSFAALHNSSEQDADRRFSAETMQHSWTSEQDVRIKLLKMRSLLKFKSFIDVLHRFFPLRPIPCEHTRWTKAILEANCRISRSTCLYGD
ncbi:hypothetical protein M378DRAFT_164077 [Amanita muscaria Koide BX008]|uniref:Uncharacterized protein n=1 Tax=Amanita muscaria (strain Koide BX008) TaxID=946122 RepID=A0A0C2WPS5_AMAMK|nr:hypothetical protein M378DRAFT_164077 [Amanita muscaria Koide BX008]